MQSDGQVVAQVLSGDTQQFEILVRRYRPALLRLAISRLPRHELAEEAVQETFLRALTSIHTYDSQYSFRTWLWTILLNQCRRSLDRHVRPDRVKCLSDVGKDEADTSLASLITREHSPLSNVIRSEQDDRLRMFLEELSTVQADALRLRFFGGLKFHEIACAMDCSLSTAKNRVRTGLLRMSQLISAGKTDGAAESTVIPDRTGERA